MPRRSTAVITTGVVGLGVNGVPFGTLSKPSTDPKYMFFASAAEAPVLKWRAGRPDSAT